MVLWKRLADAVGLRTASFGLGVVDILDRQVELILVMLAFAAVLGTSIGENSAAAESHSLRRRERHDH